MGLQHYTQDMSEIPLKYHINVLFNTKYTHPTVICRGTDERTHARTHGRTEKIYSIFRDKLLLPGEHGYIFKVYTTKGDNYFVNLAQIHDIIGDEPWFNGETKCLCNIASNRLISLSWGSKKKESSKSTETPYISTCPCVGDHVIVSNQGSKWDHLAKIVEIIESTS